MWTWAQRAGALSRAGKIVARGYAGHGPGINNPALQHVRSVGPIPQGRWRMIATSSTKGPLTIVLAPAKGTDALGRSLFRIHGDNARLDRTASHGCIILPRPIREMIWASGDRDLEVVA